MKRRSLLGTIYPFLALVALPPLVLLSVVSTATVKDIVHDQTRKTITEATYLLRNILPADRISDVGFMTRFSENAVKGTDFRITIMLPNGVVTGDSHMEPSLLENHLLRKEMQEAVHGEEGFSQRYSKSLKMEMYYFALPLRDGENLSGVLRASIPADTIRSTLRDSYMQIGAVTLFAIAGISLLSYLFAQLISRPIVKLTNMAAKFSTLDFGAISAIEGPDEIHALSKSLRKMSGILEQKFDSAVRRRKELKAVFSALVEAIIVIDGKFVVKEVNTAALRLFKIDESEACGRPFAQVARNSELNELARKTADEKASLAKTLLVKEQISSPNDEFRGGEFTSRDLYLQANTSYMETEDHDIRIILVLHDITQIKTLERIRKDFVANVSHELKTPVTSILGFVETLKEGAINRREDALEFLNIMQAQSQRLDSLIKDLLSLSALESRENTEIEREFHSFPELVSSAVEVCSAEVEKKNADIRVICPSGLKLRVNRILMEQALANLIDNAVKYCPAESTVTISGEGFADYALIRVSDNGPGIPDSDIPRVFERFYTVDKARSRELGGTGLGLAIVKHIVLAHKGEISLKRADGGGSEFVMRIPS